MIFCLKCTFFTACFLLSIVFNLYTLFLFQEKFHVVLVSKLKFYFIKPLIFYSLILLNQSFFKLIHTYSYIVCRSFYEISHLLNAFMWFREKTDGEKRSYNFNLAIFRKKYLALIFFFYLQKCKIFYSKIYTNYTCQNWINLHTFYHSYFYCVFLTHPLNSTIFRAKNVFLLDSFVVFLHYSLFSDWSFYRV